MSATSSDRVVIVTGAATGLGLSYVRKLAAEGASLVINDLSGAEEAAETLVADGHSAIGVNADIRDEGAVQAMIDVAMDRFGAIHGVINNAGILRDSSFPKMTPAQWDDVIGVHLFGARNVTKAAWPHMKAQGFGRVVFTTSTSGVFGVFGQANYSSAKLALLGLSNALALEGQRAGIVVNAIAPLATTAMTAPLWGDELKERFAAERVAPLIDYLMSASCTETGNVFLAGGGTFRRLAFFQTQGVHFSSIPSSEQFANSFSQIMDLEGASVAVHPTRDTQTESVTG